MNVQKSQKMKIFEINISGHFFIDDYNLLTLIRDFSSQVVNPNFLDCDLPTQKLILQTFYKPLMVLKTMQSFYYSCFHSQYVCLIFFLYVLVFCTFMTVFNKLDHLRQHDHQCMSTLVTEMAGKDFCKQRAVKRDISI